MLHFQIYRIATDFNYNAITKSEAKKRLLGLSDFSAELVDTFSEPVKSVVLRILSEE